ncbi:MAG: cob(I)yrinic acid a,c-diamide adenosyltransferase [Betaproteobacteria bacterium]|nr:cob(I)yrinic acid a,c-diamide adenosyltransferase [Betaproteobacteria bacterium]MBL8534353.1 cob(I)yrinic acid a,c-diamide adenosyltransferase [Betaproteobacteria bacterium]
MGNRLSKIYTRTGDDGTTGLGDGSRTAKDSLRIEAIGAVDELNSAIGVLATEPLSTDLTVLLNGIQHDLFDLGGELSIPGYVAVKEAHISALELALDRHNADMPPLKDFILPGGTRAAALCHVARTICRRAERRVVSLSQSEAGSDLPRRYLNRLSDLLFVLCRVINRDAGVTDVLWNKERSRTASE